MPANFKTYEAQARLVAAIVAAHPELRLNYKAIAQHYGKSQTVSAIEHRFRPVKQQAEILRGAVQQGIDPEAINVVEMSKEELAKYFGESTPDGLQFHFRGVKTSAETLKNAVANGQDPVASFSETKAGGGGGGGGGSGSVPPSTPSGRKRAAKPKTTDALTPGAAGKSTGKRKAAAQKVAASYVDESDDSPPVDYDALDESPTKLVKKVRTTPLKNIIPTPLRRMNTLMSGANNSNSNNTGGAGRVGGAGRASVTPTVASVASGSGASPSGSSGFGDVVTPKPAVQQAAYTLKQEALYGDDDDMNLTQTFPSYHTEDDTSGFMSFMNGESSQYGNYMDGQQGFEDAGEI
ncbi:hypothetical protein QBC46DRAFT_403906 [Diplogelasinospora grovesii]|uniref:Uncharacterized protein n=1 Tax=Diplogelasinospora grovesii TaxID=303347 RepID=A0AAN6NGN7_9PEZI|nr:hypothetical protein QBC46DRAFT_403906 [Diplogelasinospora grovesii]